jgi:peptidoglycan/LPS O-acetylase OafA/YrhL
MTQGNPRLNGLDHLRAFAIAYVFLFHYQNLVPHPKWLEALGRFGWSGVDLFFVLSGYLIGGQLLALQARGKPIVISDFYIKRVFRIVPVYLVVLALYFLIPVFRENPTITPLWKFLTFTQNFAYEKPGGVAFSHAWSLCVEEHFYLLLPALLLLLGVRNTSRRIIGLALAVLIGGLLVRAVSWEVLFPLDRNWVRWIYYPTWNRLDGLLVGVCLAAVQQFAPVRWASWTSRPGRVLGIGLAALVIAMFLCVNRASFFASVFGFPLVSAAYGLVVVAAVSPRGVLHTTSLRITYSLAAISYSLYLVHKGIIHLTHLGMAKAGMAADGALGLLVCMAMSVAAAWLLHIAVERPFMTIRSRILTRMRASDVGWAH